MKLAESLQFFKENVGRATIRAPDNYPDWDDLGYSQHRKELLRYWAEAKPRIVHNVDEVAFIDAKLAEALASFDQGQREPGQSLMFTGEEGLRSEARRQVQAASGTPIEWHFSDRATADFFRTWMRDNGFRITVVQQPK